MKCLGGYLIFVGCIFLTITDAQDIVVTFNNEERSEAKLESGASSTYIILCEVRPASVSENPNLRWVDTKTGNDVPIESADVYTVGIRRESSTLLKLTFNGVKESHAGMYNCTGTINGEVKYKSIRVEVTVKVEMDDNNVPPAQTIIRGEEGAIKCQPDGPNPTISWYRGDLSNKMNLTALPRFTQVTTGLRIFNVEEADGGVYICYAEAGSSYKRKNINVTVNWPPTITESPLVQDAVAGTPLILTCKAEGKPKPKYEFFKDLQTNKLTGSRYEINEQEGVLKIINVIKDDRGKYKCRASNGVGQPAEAEAVITVVVKPEVRDMADATFAEKGTAKLICRGTGDPTPELTWSKEGGSGSFNQGVQDDNPNLSVGSRTEQEGTETIAVSELTITNLEESDKGIYKCKAENSAGEASKNVKLIVQYSPNFNDQPYLSKYTWAGQTGKITCVANGVPLPEIKWYKNTTEIATGAPNSQYTKDRTESGPEQVTSNLHTSQINFDNIDKIVGVYRCEAINDISTASKNITLLKAARPGMPIVSVIGDTPTTITMQASATTSSQRGPAVKTMYVSYSQETGGKEEYVSANVDQNGASTIKITGLTPNTPYTFKIQAQSDAGSSDAFTQSHTTQPERKPYPIDILTRPVEGRYPNKFMINWKLPDNGGSAITAINIKYRQVTVRAEKNNENLYQRDDFLENFINLKPEPGNTVSKEISGLQRSSYYEVEVTATNKHGNSDPKAFIFKTSKGASTAGQGDVSSLSMGAIIGIVIVVFIVLFIIVDVTCYLRNRCGVLMCIKEKLGGGAAGDTRGKEAMMEGGDEETTKMLPKDNEPTVVAQDDASDKTPGELEPEDKEEIMEPPPEKKPPTPDEPEKTGIQETESKPPEAESKSPEKESAPSPTEEKGDVEKTESPKEETGTTEDKDAQPPAGSA